MTELEFRDELAALGVVPYVVEWAPGHINAEHTHDFNVRGLVLAGSLVLRVAGEDQALTPGSDFLVVAGTPHAELVGPAGAFVLAGRWPAADPAPAAGQAR